MKFNKTHIQHFLVILPFLMVLIAEMIQISNNSLSGKLKVLSVVYMFTYAFLKRKLNTNLTAGFLIFIPFLIYGILNSFKLKAGIEEGIRYLFPIGVIFYSYSIREHYKFLFKTVLIFVVINDLWQIVNYYYWIKGETQWFYLENPKNGFRYYNATSGVIRATGLLVFFGLFGFLNALTYFVVKKYYYGKYRKFLLGLTLISTFLSFSYKIIGPFLLVLFLSSKNKLKIIMALGIGLLSAIIIMPKKMQSIFYNIALRLNAYIIEGDSARSESYRVMFRDIFNFNLFGRGVGSFGGPASTTYNSPVYKIVHFNWFSTPGMATTDTFYPHIFVELGLIGGLLYLLVLLIPLLRTLPLKRLDVVYILYAFLFFDAIFSFSLNNIAYLMASLVFVYPLIEYEKKQYKKNTILS